MDDDLGVARHDETETPESRAPGLFRAGAQSNEFGVSTENHGCLGLPTSLANIQWGKRWSQ